jgi:hypothetical protein
MKVLGIRFCTCTPEVQGVIATLRALGLPEMALPAEAAAFEGAIFPAGSSWVEVWKSGPEMPEGTMLQVVVDDAEAFAAHACANGLKPEGPMEAHGERIFFLKLPGGMQMSFQSALG